MRADATLNNGNFSGAQDVLREEAQVEELIMSLRKYGKIDLPMNEKFEKAMKELRTMITQVASPYYT